MGTTIRAETDLVDIETNSKELLEYIVLSGQFNLGQDQYEKDDSIGETIYALRNLPQDKLLKYLAKEQDELKGYDYVVRESIGREPMRLQVKGYATEDLDEISVILISG